MTMVMGIALTLAVCNCKSIKKSWKKQTSADYSCASGSAFSKGKKGEPV